MEYITRHIDDPDGTSYTIAPEDISRAICRRLDPRPVVFHPTQENVFIFDPDNFWDGPTHVTWHPEIGHFSFRGYGDLELFPMVGPLR